MYLRDTTLLRICGYYTCDCCVVYPITLWYAIWPGGGRLPKYGLSQDWTIAGASSAKDMEASNDPQRALGNTQNCQSQPTKKSLHRKSSAEAYSNQTGGAYPLLCLKCDI